MSGKRVHVVYSGAVQGVGFRITVDRVARELKMDGWVKNLPDGGVELVAEGREDRLKEFLDKIRAGLLGRYIKNEDISWSQANGDFAGFDIRF